MVRRRQAAHGGATSPTSRLPTIAPPSIARSDYLFTLPPLLVILPTTCPGDGRSACPNTSLHG